MHNALKEESPKLSKIRCPSCGDYYSYLFLQYTIVAYCPNLAVTRLDAKMADRSFDMNSDACVYLGCRDADDPDS